MTMPESPAEVPSEPATLNPSASLESLLGDIAVEVSVELGRARLSLREAALHLTPGSVIELLKLTGDPLDIRINDRLIARGEAVAVGERYAVRVTEIMGMGERGL